MQANRLVKINGNAIEQIVYKSQPVITLRMMDELHERKKALQETHFSRHKEHLLENVRFFYLCLMMNGDPLLKILTAVMIQVKEIQ
jgi:ORF6N domain.